MASSLLAQFIKGVLYTHPEFSLYRDCFNSSGQGMAELCALQNTFKIICMRYFGGDMIIHSKFHKNHPQLF